MKKFLKYLFLLAIVLFVGYHSVYFRKLDEVQAGTKARKINTAAYSRTFWDKKLPRAIDKAVSLTALMEQLRSLPEKAFEAHGNALGIGELKYFMVKGEGSVKQVNENDILIRIPSQKAGSTLRIATEYVFGNAVRDASGLINMNEFDNTADFNEVSAGINRIIREEVLPGFKQKVKNGDSISFTGAIELNRRFLNLSDIEITPVQLTILNR